MRLPVKSERFRLHFLLGGGGGNLNVRRVMARQIDAEGRALAHYTVAEE